MDDYSTHSISSIHKWNAYKDIVADASAAAEILSNKKLAYGEVAFVPYYYPNEQEPEEYRQIYMMLGIGWFNGKSRCYPVDEIIKDSIGYRVVERFNS